MLEVFNPTKRDLVVAVISILLTIGTQKAYKAVKKKKLSKYYDEEKE